MGKRMIWQAAFVVGAAGLATAAVSEVSLGEARSVRVRLHDAAAVEVGSVRFADEDGATTVRVELQFDPTRVAVNAFHGFHVHANDDASNGAGCVADPTSAPTTWFTSADGHWKLAAQGHGAHLGDLFSVYVTGDGSAEARFVTDRFSVADLAGRAVMIHAGPDNFGNVPVGTALNQYAANGTDATTLTANTGNAGARIACGVVGG